MTEWTLSRVSVSPVSCEILRGVIFRIRKQQHLDITGQSCRNQKTLQTNLTTVVCAETRDLKSFFSLSFSLLLLFLLSSHLSPPLPSSSTCPPFPFTPLLLLASVTLIFLYSCPKPTSPFQADFWSSFCLVSGLLFILFSVVPLLFLLQKQKRKKKKQKKPHYLCPFFSSSYTPLPFLLALMPQPLSLFLLLQPRRPPHLQLTLISVIGRIFCSPAECLGRQLGCSQSNQLRSHRPRLPFNLWFSAWHTRSLFQLTPASVFISANCSDRCVRTVQFIWRRRRHQGRSSLMWSKRKIHPQVSAFASSQFLSCQTPPVISTVILRPAIWGGCVKSY